VSPHLQTLDGRPLSWPQLRRQLAAYYQRRGEVRVSSDCVQYGHASCTGWMASESGSQARVDLVACGCECHTR
jgi:hypothetical protein